MLLSVRSLEKHYGSEVVFSDISFVLDDCHRVALVGSNGSGKSTIIKIINGLVKQDSGSVVMPDGKTVSYLPQEVKGGDLRTGIEYIESGTDLKPHMFFPVLNGLGVSEEVAKQPLADMSGGQQTKILLVRFLLEPSDVLLLDEPTNNLDIPSLIWLESFLSSSKKAMIIISHDVSFLNNVTNRVFELKDGSLNIERGSYGDYIERKKKELVTKKKEYDSHIKKVNQLENVRRELHDRSIKIDKSNSDEKVAPDNDKMLAFAKKDSASSGQRVARVIGNKIKRMGVVKKPIEEEPFNLNLNARNSDGVVEVSATDLIVGYDDGIKVGPVTFSIELGERVCFLGSNGSGKSTLLKTITGVLDPIEGSVNVTEGVSFGYLMQQHEFVNSPLTAIEFFRKETNSDFEKSVHNLKLSGFTDYTINQKIAGLSSGMRARLLFSIFVSKGVNFLVLDEPTNHLDIDAVVALSNLLKSYKGSVIIVSHNRSFLSGMNVDKFYEIVDGGVSMIKDFDKHIKESSDRANSMTRKLRRSVS